MAYQDVKTPWEGWYVTNLIGKGGFGSVYEIERSQYGIQERAAMKVITIPQSADEIDDLRIEGYDNNSITQRFDAFAEDIVREYGMMAQMKGNANIVYCDDYRIIQQDNGFGRDVYIRMELLTPLLKAMDRVSSEQQIIRFGMDMCNALATCQKRKVIHRDIKPQNIFVSDDGIFKLGDFGIARKAEKTTRATVGKGTYQFMAPEVKNEQPYGPTVDIYSLGLVMYWLLNNKRSPFLPLPPAAPAYSDEQNALQRRFSGEELPAPKMGSNELKRIVLKACAFDPKDRYQTAQEMWEDLARLSSGHTEKFVPDPEPSPDPIVPDDFDDDKTVGPVFHYVPAVDSEDLDKTVGPVFAAENQKVAENLDVHQTLQFLHDDNPAGKVIAVQVGNDTMRVLIPQQFENGQTLYYEGMGLKSAYSEARGNLYLTVSIAPQTAPVPPVVPPEKENTSKIWPILAAVVVLMLIIMGIWKSAFPNTNNQQNNSHQHIWIAANCTKPNTCNSCGATSGTALGHNWKEATYNSPKTCTRCGQTEGEPLATEGNMQDNFGLIEKVKNERGDVIKTIYRTASGEIMSWVESEYDSSGKEINRKLYLSTGVLLASVFYNDDNKICFDIAQHNQYDLLSLNNDWKVTYVEVYDDTGNQTVTIVHKYDEHGNCTESFSFTNDGVNNSSVYVHEYDYKNRLLKTHREDGGWSDYKYSDSDNVRLETSYDAQGTIAYITETNYSASGSFRCVHYGRNGEVTMIEEAIANDEGKIFLEVFYWPDGSLHCILPVLYFFDQNEAVEIWVYQ